MHGTESANWRLSVAQKRFDQRHARIGKQRAGQRKQMKSLAVIALATMRIRRYLGYSFTRILFR